MTALPDWMMLPPEGLSAAAYEALPEEICRRIEIVDGAIVVNPAPSRPHQRIVRRLAQILEEASAPGWRADIDVDLRLADVPLHVRRPDVAIYDAALPDDDELRPQHCLMVVEVVSPGSTVADRMDKPAEYARVGIRHYWRVEIDEDRKPTIFRHRLDPATGMYASAGASTGTMVISDPFPISVDLGELNR